MKTPLIIALIPFLIACGCKNKAKNNPSNDAIKVTQEILNNVEAKLIEPGYFWSDRSREFQFKNDGTVKSLFRGQIEKGKWTFDKKSNRLEIAWEKHNQSSASIKEIYKDWSYIIFNVSIHPNGNDVLEKMKLLDDRFNR